MGMSRMLKTAGVMAFVLAAGLTPSAALAQAGDKPAGEAKAADIKPLKVGDPAPRIAVEKWVKGKEVKSFEKGKVYVVEFWATWCPPCKKSIPHLTEVATKHKDKVEVIGVSVWENNDPAEGKDAYLKRVTEFANKGPLADKMMYNVAYDGDSGEMAQTWMKAAKRFTRSRVASV